MRHLTVVDDEDKLAGVITDRDIRQAGVFGEAGAMPPEPDEPFDMMTVHDLMTTPGDKPSGKVDLRKQRDRWASTEIRVPAPPLRGVIAKPFPQEGYGFILQEDGGEVYFHRNAVHGLEFEALEDGTEVSFNVEEGDKGPPLNAYALASQAA